MTAPTPAPHLYLRSVDSVQAGARTSLALLAGHVASGARVLDVGCGSGALGAFLQQHKQCVCDGITMNPAEAALAAPFYRRVHVADLESGDWAQLLDGAQYDAIVCADILEHLRQPEVQLAVLRQHLDAGGRLLISVPNAAYCGLLAELLHGELRYRDEGLLDRTHLRFFTRRSLLRFLHEQRWQVHALDTVERALHESEFRLAWDRLPPAVARYLLAAADALAYQFIVSASALAAHEESGEEHTAATAPPYPPVQALFSAQLYCRRGGHYDEGREKIVACGIIGAPRQTLRFALPPAQDASPIERLRLDPADRPGFLHLYRLRLLDAQGQALWQWCSSEGAGVLLGQRPCQQLLYSAPAPAAAFALMLLLTGDDPWFELPIPAQIFTARQPAALEVELGWPMSADYLALAHTVQPLQEQVAQETQRLELAQQARQQLEKRIRQQQYIYATLQENWRTQTQERIYWQTQATRLQNDFAQLARHLKNIENSTIFRATRPLVHAKMRVDRLLGRTPGRAQTPLPVPQTPPDAPVDIIVPVYRGLEDTRRCVQSVLASTCQVPWHLILINDASPESALADWLRAVAAQDARITLLENDGNLGFVATVNRGMALNGTRDVLLLNSDTEVAGDWLDRLRRAAYGDARIASVTPFSNNATICSYPLFCQPNALPRGWTVAALDALCAQTLAGEVIDAPTGVGFCMYIRRDCLDAIGLFDVERFGKGYGEENDFCQRAAQAGWRNLHLLDTFVLHSGGASFGESKSARELAAMQTLDRLHPRYASEVAQFVQRDPAQPARLRLDAARLHQDAVGKTVILAVLHDREGGTARHVRELAAHFCDKALFLTLSPAAGGCVVLRRAEAQEGFALRFGFGGAEKDQTEDLLHALRQLGVAHIHYHHLLGHDRAIYDLPARLGVQYDFTAHDFYSYCANISLTGADARYIPPPAANISPGQCGCCAGDSPAPAPLHGSIAHWRHRNALLLADARHVLAPSRDTATRIATLVPGVRIRAVSHLDLPDPQAQPLPQVRAPALRPDAPLKIVVLGALSAIKGAEVLEAVALLAARRQAPVELHLLGYAWRSVKTRPASYLSVHGAYQERDLPALLDWLQPHLAWFPAQWPETYSYTLSACLAAGLPVAAPDLGAFPERLGGRTWSWLLPWDGSAQQWLDFFLHVREAHFLPGNAPSPLPAFDSPAQNGHTFYKQHYLQGIAPRNQKRQLLDAAFLAAHAVQAPDAHGGARMQALHWLAWLRAHPLLRPLARRIPVHWQRRVKNWLRA